MHVGEANMAIVLGEQVVAAVRTVRMGNIKMEIPKRRIMQGEAIQGLAKVARAVVKEIILLVPRPQPRAQDVAVDNIKTHPVTKAIAKVVRAVMKAPLGLVLRVRAIECAVTAPQENFKTRLRTKTIAKYVLPVGRGNTGHAVILSEESISSAQTVRLEDIRIKRPTKMCARLALRAITPLQAIQPAAAVLLIIIKTPMTRVAVRLAMHTLTRIKLLRRVVLTSSAMILLFMLRPRHS